MRIDKSLAEVIARSAMTEPFRQVKVMTSGDLASWLGQRGIHIRWQSLHHLWAVGVLHPIIAFDSALESIKTPANRFVQIDLGQRGTTFLDLGDDVVSIPFFEHPILKMPGRLSDSLLWHPFQLWIFLKVADILRVRYTLDQVLVQPSSYAGFADKLAGQVPDRLIRFANSPRHQEFLRLLGLLLSAEPLVHAQVFGNIRMSLSESLEDYYTWQSGQSSANFLNATGLTLGQATDWHRELSIAAVIKDPIENFRILLRHASRDQRSRLKEEALLAHDLYDQAECLRRYLEEYLGQQLPEEDDVRSGPMRQSFKERFYGSARTADFDRAVFRRIARDFGVDPQARTTWFVEGDTEEGFIRQFASQIHLDLSKVGIERENLRGKGSLTKDSRFRDRLERLRREEIFAFISIDEDGGGEHLRDLRKLAADGLVTAGFRVWRPDFEQANFSLDELARVATRLARADGIEVTITGTDVQREMRLHGIAAGVAIKRLWHRNLFYGGKGDVWGCALADWAFEHRCPAEITDEKGNRPIVSLFSYLYMGQISDYKLSVEINKVTEDGQVVPM